MENNIENSSNKVADNDQEINIRDIFILIWNLKYWIIISIVAVLCASYLYLKTVTPIYNRTISVMLVRESQGSSSKQLSFMFDLTGEHQGMNIDDEIYIMKSPSLMSKVVTDLNLNNQYAKEGNFIFDADTYYYKNNPFSGKVLNNQVYSNNTTQSNNSNNITSLYMKYKMEDAKTYKILDLSVNGEDQDVDKDILYSFGKISNFEYKTKKSSGDLVYRISITNEKAMEAGASYTWSYNQPYATAKSIVSNMSIVNLGDKMSKTDVIELSLKDSNPNRAEDILNKLISVYNLQSRTLKNESNMGALSFINSRLAEISKQLEDVEDEIKNYQTSNTLIDLSSQSKLSLESGSEFRKKLTEVQLQRKLLAMVSDYMKDNDSGDYKVIPAAGFADEGLNSTINIYNESVILRNRLLINSSENNPRVLILNKRLADNRESILETISSLDKSYSIQEQELDKTISSNIKQISVIPGQQVRLAEITRKQDIIEPLYVMLRQKKEETQIALYSIVDNVRVVEPAFGDNIPIAPKKEMIYLIALILGVSLPPLIVWGIKLFRYKVVTQEDLENLTDIPILATLPHFDDTQTFIKASGRDIKSEAFRMLRTNLQFLKGNIIQVTSSFPGEGKSYIAVNLAVSLSHLHGKVLLIGLDLRKPVLEQRLSTIEHVKKNSVVGYLIGKADNIDQLPTKSKIEPNLDIIFSGFVPPNPTELLASPKMAEIFNYFKDKYDYIICDSAPFMPVSDALIINKFVDSTLYVVKSNYTRLDTIPLINKTINSKKLKNVNIVLNDLYMSKKILGYSSYGYGYGYGSGYGYGYGYGNAGIYGYSQSDKSKNKESSKFKK